MFTPFSSPHPVRSARSRDRRRAVRSLLAAGAVSALALSAYAAPSFASDGSQPVAGATGADGTGADGTGAGASVRLDPRHEEGGAVPQNFVGLSLEWSLVERYMGPNARPAFANLLKNLGTGVLRIGGSSQDLMPFVPDATNTNEVVTPDDLALIRSTLDATNAGDADTARPAWGVVLGTAMSPPSDRRPFVSPDHAHTFVTQGVAPAFSGKAARYVAGIELGNETDLSYGASRYGAYLDDLRTYSARGVTGPFPVIAPNTSEDILPWQTIAAGPTRYFWNWPQILDVFAPGAKTRAGAFGAYASDHFYPLARTCNGKPYRCATIPALLSDEHMQSLDYQVYEHAEEAARHGLGYRLEETNTAAGRGADGVSNVAASATYALDMMFNAACPQPPQAPSANTACGTGAIGVNLHNAEVRAFFSPEEGNGYYNAVDYDPSPAMGAPTAAPEYYALLLFSKFAQGTSGLRPVAVSTDDPTAGNQVKAWRVEGSAAERRLFLINKSDRPVTLTVDAPGSSALVDRMTPYDPTGAGKTLDAAQVRIDGRQVAADGTWPGFDATQEQIKGDRLTMTLGAGEASVIAIHQHDD